MCVCVCVCVWSQIKGVSGVDLETRERAHKAALACERREQAEAERAERDRERAA